MPNVSTLCIFDCACFQLKPYLYQVCNPPKRTRQRSALFVVAEQCFDLLPIFAAMANFMDDANGQAKRNRPGKKLMAKPHPKQLTPATD